MLLFIGHETLCYIYHCGLNLYPNALNAHTPMCRTGRVSTQASEPLKRNLFLQRLYEEEEKPNINEIPGSNNDSQNEYEDKDVVECLENGVKFWTDYSKVHYHPRSLYELDGVWANIEEFNNYGIGRDSFTWAAQGEEISDRLRFFVEECDHIQVTTFSLFQSCSWISGLLLMYNFNRCCEIMNGDNIQCQWIFNKFSIFSPFVFSNFIFRVGLYI